MRFCFVLLMCAISTWTCAQDKVAASKDAPAPESLQLTSRAIVPFAGALAGKARCDDDGNVYVRLLDAETSKQQHPISILPIQRISPNGSLTGSFSIASVSPRLSAIDFFVANDGKVYLAGRSDAEGALYVVLFSRDGLVESKVKLDVPFFIPYQIVVFRSGEFLLSGIHGSRNRTPYTGVFNAGGKLIKEIYETEDEDSRKRTEAGEPNFVPDYSDYGNNFVVHGDGVLGSDGNAYLLRSVSPALIYVISPKGEVIRKLQVDSPGSGLLAKRIKSAPGSLAISFLKKGMNTGMIQVVNYQGKSIAAYSSDDKTMYPGLLGCYGSAGFTFLSIDEGNGVRLQKAEPKIDKY